MSPGQPGRPPRTRTCAQCGNPYKGMGQKYCSHRCYTLSRGWTPLVDDKDRSYEMVDLYRTGTYTLQQIAEQYGVTRERVRQLIKAAAPTLSQEMAAEKRLKRFQEKAERERLKSLPRKCALCNRDFANGYGNQKYCSDCGAFHQIYGLMINPHRHEMHRLYMALSILRNPEKHVGGMMGGREISHAQEMFWHWRKHGHLPPPNREHYVFSPKAQGFIEHVGIDRWHEILNGFERHYADTSRKLTLRKDPGYDMPGLKW